MKNDQKWVELQKKYPKGTRVQGTVFRHLSFGIELKIAEFECQCLITITEFKTTERMTPEEFPSVGIQVEADVLGFSEHPDGRRECKLSMQNTFKKP